jgi:hypothetical protein
LYSQQRILDHPPLFLYRYRFEPGFFFLSPAPPTPDTEAATLSPTLAIRSYSALLALYLQMYSTILSAPHA